MRPSIELGREEARRGLGEVLSGAHAGELGAALAYDGHWRSLRDPEEIADVHRIELEELEHRRRVRAILDDLGVAPAPWRERLMFCIGSTISWLCRVGGWLIPMYGAGALESRNVREYEHAARFAVLAGVVPIVADLLHMAEVEWDHERYFRTKVESHWLSPVLPMWKAPPPRETIQDSFAEFVAAAREAEVRLSGAQGYER